MENISYRTYDGKVIIRLRDRVCDTPEQMLSSALFLDILTRCLHDLTQHNSKLLNIFDHENVTKKDIQLLVKTLQFLIRLPAELVPKVVEGSDQFFRDPVLFNDFVEYLYNHWRSLSRLIICDSEGDRYDKRPYHTFNNTVESLMHLVRGTYRDIQENITGNHPRIYRQVSAGAEIAAIALPKDIAYPENYTKLNTVSIIRQC